MFRPLILLLLLAACSVTSSKPLNEQLTTVSGIQILGVAQDGGRPQLACAKTCCANIKSPALVAAIGVHSSTGWVLVDATPDIAAQIKLAGSFPSAVVLTHAHIGHYLGLAQLGREAAGCSSVPVWCSQRMANFLKNNGPWSQLIKLGNIEIHVFNSGQAFSPIDDIEFTPIAVPHRDEFSDTHGFSINISGLRTLYIPDIDSWKKWDSFADTAQLHDIAILDATFFDNNELPGRDMSAIPHPRVPDSMALLTPICQTTKLRVVFTHLNHTNPLWDKSSWQSQQVEENGFEVATRGIFLSR